MAGTLWVVPSTFINTSIKNWYSMCPMQCLVRLSCSQLTLQQAHNWSLCRFTLQRKNKGPLFHITYPFLYPNLHTYSPVQHSPVQGQERRKTLSYTYRSYTYQSSGLHTWFQLTKTSKLSKNWSPEPKLLSPLSCVDVHSFDTTLSNYSVTR